MTRVRVCYEAAYPAFVVFVCFAHDGPEDDVRLQLKCFPCLETPAQRV